jgi:hypothetical protein
MGNRIGGRRRAGVEERYTRPQGLYEHRDIDQKKLRKLILEAKLAPCYPGADDAAGGHLEECPICFLVTDLSSPPPSSSLPLPPPTPAKFCCPAPLLACRRNGMFDASLPIHWVDYCGVPLA